MSISALSKKYFLLAVQGAHVGKRSDVDIAVRCPVCGDSKKNKRSARLHLYQKGDYEGVSCFNGDCAVHNKTVYSFLRDFYPSLLTGFKRESFQSKMSTLLGNDETTDVFAGLKTSKPNIEKVSKIQTQDLSSYMTLLSESAEGLNYLTSRGLKYDENWGKWFYGHQDLKIGEILYKLTDAIIIPLYYNNEMYGFYSRNVKSKTFYTYMQPVNVGYKIFNWFNVNKSEPVYIFEGVFDCVASGLPNSIALLGAKLPQERLSELKTPVFVLDNDRTGLLNSLQYAKSGAQVYVQPQHLKEKDVNEMLLNNVNVSSVILKNLFTGIFAEIQIQSKL